MTHPMKLDDPDLTAVLDKFKLATPDMTAFLEERRLDVQALVDANQAAFAAMQSLARTQADMLTQALQAAQASSLRAARGKATDHDPAQGFEAGRDAWQKMLADVKALAEMAQKSQMAAVASLGARVEKSVAEAGKLLASK